MGTANVGRHRYHGDRDPQGLTNTALALVSIAATAACPRRSPAVKGIAAPPAVEAARIAKPARIYDLRTTFASNALAAGVTVFELARVMGTSVHMIERHYGALLDG